MKVTSSGIPRAKPDAQIVWRVDKVVRSEVSRQCPRCMGKGVKRGAVRFKRIQEIFAGVATIHEADEASCLEVVEKVLQEIEE